MRSVGHTSQLQISCYIQKCLNLYACFVSCVEGTCDRYGDLVSLSEIIPFTRASTGNFMSRLVFTRSPQPYFPFPIRVTIAGDGLVMSLRIYCRLGYRINTKYLFSSYVSALRIWSITSHIGHVLKASVTAFFFLLEQFFGHDRSAHLWFTWESFAPTLKFLPC